MKNRISLIDTIIIVACGLILGALIGATSGCSSLGSIRMQPGQERAADIVWHGTYGQESPVPKIRWVTGKDLDCNHGHGFSVLKLDEFDQPVAECVEGFTWQFDEVSVAFFGQYSYSETSMAHEFWHVVNLLHLIFDTQHRGDGWYPLSKCKDSTSTTCGIVERANNALVSQGL